ncbi:hypothetical protein Ancab_033893 [Ancistrocladus abbreviatus]
MPHWQALKAPFFTPPLSLSLSSLPHITAAAPPLLQLPFAQCLQLPLAFPANTKAHPQTRISSADEKAIQQIHLSSSTTISHSPKQQILPLQQQKLDFDAVILKVDLYLKAINEIQSPLNREKGLGMYGRVVPFEFSF